MSEGQDKGTGARLLALWAALGTVKRDRSNPAFKSRYATLEAVLDEVRGACIEHGFILTQEALGADSGGTVGVKTALLDGALLLPVLSHHCTLGTKDAHDPQKAGSGITYARRYALLAMFALGTADDDGNEAARPVPMRAVAPAPIMAQVVASAPRVDVDALKQRIVDAKTPALRKAVRAEIAAYHGEGRADLERLYNMACAPPKGTKAASDDTELAF